MTPRDALAHFRHLEEFGYLVEEDSVALASLALAVKRVEELERENRSLRSSFVEDEPVYGGTR